MSFSVTWFPISLQPSSKFYIATLQCYRVLGHLPHKISSFAKIPARTEGLFTWNIKKEGFERISKYPCLDLFDPSCNIIGKSHKKTITWTAQEVLSGFFYILMENNGTKIFYFYFAP